MCKPGTMLGHFLTQKGGLVDSYLDSLVQLYIAGLFTTPTTLSSITDTFLVECPRFCVTLMSVV